MALGRKLGRNDSWVQKTLPLAQGLQYLCALAISNGATPVWADMHESIDSKIARAGELLKTALNISHHEFQDRHR
jgi:hypothetical protein